MDSETTTLSLGNNWETSLRHPSLREVFELYILTGVSAKFKDMVVRNDRQSLEIIQGYFDSLIRHLEATRHSTADYLNIAIYILGCMSAGKGFPEPKSIPETGAISQHIPQQRLLETESEHTRRKETYAREHNLDARFVFLDYLVEHGNPEITFRKELVDAYRASRLSGDWRSRELWAGITRETYAANTVVVLNGLFDTDADARSVELTIKIAATKVTRVLNFEPPRGQFTPNTPSPSAARV